MVAFGEALGRAFLPFLDLATAQSGATIYFLGDLGAGKTTMSRGVLRAFGHSGPVKSPTYTLVEPYELSGRRVNHFDLYRLGDPEELEYMGIRDYFSAGSLSLLEWPHRGEGFLPNADIRVTVTAQGEGREVQLLAETDMGQAVLSALTEEKPSS